jgi:hypothetical protein
MLLPPGMPGAGSPGAEEAAGDAGRKVSCRRRRAQRRLQETPEMAGDGRKDRREKGILISDFKDPDGEECSC